MKKEIKVDIYFLAPLLLISIFSWVFLSFYFSLSTIIFQILLISHKIYFVKKYDILRKIDVYRTELNENDYPFNHFCKNKYDVIEIYSNFKHRLIVHDFDNLYHDDMFVKYMYKNHFNILENYPFFESGGEKEKVNLIYRKFKLEKIKKKLGS